MSRISEMLGSRYPVIQGAMGVICNPELVAAVSEAGGFGLLATAFAEDPEMVRDEVRRTKELTDNPFGANLFVMNPLAAKFAEVLAEEGIRAVTVSAGSPKELIPLLHDKCVKVIVVVSAVNAARGAEAAGADAIVAEGAESGGVQGFQGISTMVLVPSVVDAVNVPVIAAGGIGDSRGYRAAMALGAQGVQVGTRFIATKECIANGIYKNTIVEVGEFGTGLVNMGRFQIRALRTPLAEKMIKGEKGPDNIFTPAALKEAWIKGDLEAGVLAAGQISGSVHDILSVREVIEEMVDGEKRSP
ncbi:MAG: nitronate monooxygenase [Deltaproteobacteria bacterium]|nr:nitronate monooxygenase [Deltaproteobacteria bacterium]MBW2119275.1 nitronate monooxygenase [Deltaproteobacteria bacterium]MBW2344015.1 nitronate monooxygenase [Deltaproteobacteria bacterium]